MLRFPEPPTDLPDEQRGEGAMSLRFEDVAQDGRLLVEAIPHGFGEVVWAKILGKHPVVVTFTKQGVVPILSRVIVEGLGGPIAVRHPLHAVGAFQLAHTVDDHGAVNRIVMNMWIDVYGTKARTYGPPPEGAGARVHLGRAFAEHVFSRPFGDPATRKVVALDVPSLPKVPPDRYVWERGDDVAELPAGATPLDDAPVDAASIVFGLDHTDSNQHVNSLVYPRLFQDAALRRFDALGRSTRLLARYVEMTYRKPCFAGDRLQIVARAFELDGKLGAVGAFQSSGQVATRPHCWVRTVFEE